MKYPRRLFSLKHIALLASALVFAPLASAMEPIPAPKAERYRELVHIVRQDCGSCHGLTLLGGLGPALTVGALADKPAEGLVATIIGGRPGTAMPPFRGIVSETEAEWIVDQLMRGFPPDRGLAPSGGHP
ncbi:MAG: c-type cytochrome [Azovibrio sp.]